MSSSSSSPTSNLENFSGISSFTPHTFSTPISLKLNDDNFILWQQQVTATVHGLNLSQFLEHPSSPPQFLTAENSESPTINPLFRQHQQRDHLLVSWLLASMTTPILKKMVGLCTTYQI